MAKDTQSTKDSKKAPNKITEEAGLIFNVNTVKRHMIKKFKLILDANNRNESDDKKKGPNIAKGHVAVTACVEKLIKILINVCLENTVVQKNGCRTIHRHLLFTAIKNERILWDFYESKMRTWDKDNTYQDLLPFLETDTNTIINSIDESLKFTDKAKNMFNFFVNKFYTSLINKCLILLEYSGKKSLDPRVVQYAVGFIFTEEIKNQLLTELHRVCELVGSGIDKKSDEDCEDYNTENQDDDNNNDDQDSDADADADDGNEDENEDEEEDNVENQDDENNDDSDDDDFFNEDDNNVDSNGFTDDEDEDEKKKETPKKNTSKKNEKANTKKANTKKADTKKVDKKADTKKADTKVDTKKNTLKKPDVDVKKTTPKKPDVNTKKTTPKKN